MKEVLYKRSPQDDSLASKAHRINHTNMLTCQIKVNSFREEHFFLKLKEYEKTE